MFGVLAILLALFMAGGNAQATQTDATGQWRYSLVNGGAYIDRKVDAPRGNLLIPNELDGYPVTGILEGAFEFSDKLASVVIPEGVTDICDEAFMGCESLTSVTFPHSVLNIGNKAFYGCHRLTGLSLPEGLTSIGGLAFDDCWYLADVLLIPNSVASIGINPFASCDIAYFNGPSDNPVYVNIDGVLFDKQQKMLVSYPGAKEGVYAIPEGILHIGDYAFLRCESLTDVTIPGSVTSIGEAAFVRCEGLTSVTIPGSVTNINDWAFSHCYNLTSLNLPDSVTSIGKYAFSLSNLTDVTIPASVTFIDKTAFYNCYGLILSVAKGSYAEQYAEENGILYRYSLPEAEKLDATDQLFFVVEDGAATITLYVDGPEVDLIIPEELGGYPVTGIGEYAFWHGNVESVIIPAGVTYIAGNAFYIDDEYFGSNALRFYVAKDSYAEQFAQENYVHYDRIDASGQWKYRPDWEDDDYEDGVAIIGYAVEPTGDLVFPSELDGYPVVGIGVDLAIYYGIKGALEGCADLVSVTIPDGVVYIRDGAFKQCGSLTSVTFPGSVTIIDTEAFYGCGALTSITIPGVDCIFERAFEGCGALTSITLPADLEYIYDKAFEGCGELVLRVTEGSYGEEYAIENSIPYVLVAE